MWLYAVFMVKKMTMERRAEILKELEKLGDIQGQNPPSSEAWQNASKRIHELAAQLTGKQNNDAWGKK